MRLALATCLALLAVPAAAAPNALAAVADGLAADVGPPAEGRAALLLAVEASPGLRAPLETALDAALAARGYAVTRHRGGREAEEAARAGGQDWLLRVRGGLVPGRRELAAVGELIPAWASFFMQRRPGARAVPPRIVQASAAADSETLLLGRELRPAGAPFASIRPLARVGGRVLALAVGDAGAAGHASIVVVTADAVRVLSTTGAPLAERTADPAELRPVRAPAATVAVGDFGGGRIALQRAGAARGEVLALAGDRLERAGEVEGAPLCAGEAGRLFGAFEPGTGVLRDVLSPLVDAGAAPRSARLLYGAACAPRSGPVAFAALGTDLRVELLGPDLRPAGSPRAAVTTGSAFALADLDGDGVAELVASSGDPAGPERIRILAPLAEASLLLESQPVEGALLAGAGGDVTGDGVDDAVLGAVSDGADGPGTLLLVVTSDPRVPP